MDRRTSRQSRVEQALPAPAVESLAEAHERRPRAYDHAGAPPVRGSRTVHALLPNGRVAWLTFGPALAPAAETSRLFEIAGQAQHRRAGEIERLSRTLSEDARLLARAQLRGDRKLARRLAAGDAKLAARAAAELEKARSAFEAQQTRERELAARLRRRDFWDQLVIVGSAPLFAAYGQRSNPVGINNLTLAVSLLVWLVGDHLAEFLAEPERGEPEALRDADVWSYVAPAANVLTGWWLMRQRQHERLLAGLAEGFVLEDMTVRLAGQRRERTDSYVARVDLASRVAADHAADFMSFANVPAVASVASLTWAEDLGSVTVPEVRSIRAAVNAGVLTITLTVVAFEDLRDAELAVPGSPVPPLIDTLTAAWVADTRGS